MKKIVKVAALIAVAAVMMGCKPTTGGNTAGGDNNGGTSGGTNTETTGSDTPAPATDDKTDDKKDDKKDETPAVQTKFTNDAWVIEPTKAYDGIFIDVADTLKGVDLTKYEMVKVNVSFLDADGKEIVYKYPSSLSGQVIALGEGDWNPISTISNVVPMGVSQYEGAFVPLTVDLKKIAIQNSGDNCKKMKVNYIELIEKSEGTVYATIEAAKAADSTGKKVYLAFTMTAEGKGGWGVGGLVDDTYTAVEEVSATATYTPGEVIEAEVTKLASSAHVNFYNAASFAYFRIK